MTSLLAPLLGILLPMDASALRRPSFKEETEIRSHIEKGKAAGFEMQADGSIYAIALKLKRELEAKMGLPLDRDGDATRAPTEGELGRLIGWFSDRRDEYRNSVSTVEETRRARDYHLNKAIELSDRYFLLGPVLAEGEVRYNADPPLVGKHWRWRARYLPGAGPHAQDPKIGGARSLIAEDGTVLLRESAFDSLAMLAFSLRHEAMHYNLALADREYGQLRREEEAMLYGAGLMNAGPLGLGTQEFQFWLKQAVGYGLFAREDRRRIAQGERPPTPHGAFDVEVDQQEWDETMRRADADLARFDAALARGNSPESLERLRAELESEYLKALNPGVFERVFKGWQSARENDRQAPVREQWVKHYRIELEAAACGFEMTPEGYFYSTGVPPFRIYHGGDPDTARAAFLLLRACLGQGWPNDRPCNDAIGVVVQRWSDRDSRNRMMKVRTSDPFIDGVSSDGQCLIALRDKWNPRGDWEDLRSFIHKDYRERYAREHPGQAPPREAPRRRDDPESPPRGGSGQCYWRNDGVEICP